MFSETSRTAVVVENSFLKPDCLSFRNVFSFHRPIIAHVHKVKAITKAVVALHNFLMSAKNSDNLYDYCPNNFVDRDGPTGIQLGDWRQQERNVNGLVPLCNLGSNNYSQHAKLVREAYKEYFNNEGAVEW